MSRLIHPPLKTLAFVSLCFLTILVYMAMIAGPLTNLQDMADGMRPFDLLPGGYDLEYARRFIHTIGDDGVALYLHRQLVLDSFYPGLLAGLLFWCWQGLSARNIATFIIRTGQSLAVFAALFDYTENVCIAVILMDPATLTDTIIRLASTATMLKSLITSLTAIALAGCWIWQWRQGHHRCPD